MSIDPHSANSTGNGGYERQDIGAAGVLYFLLGIAVAGFLAYFIVDGLYHFLDRRSEAEQAPVNPLVTNAPEDTRQIPKQYNGDYEKFLKENFPAPQLEIDERNQLDKIRKDEERTLATYDYIDKNAGTVRIPIDRAMDLIAQRGLPVRAQSATGDEPVQENKKAAKK
jgi:hypothetical protein